MPVADYAVELNTGVLVYKECVLRNIVVRQREAALAAITRKADTAIQTGRGGNKQFVENQTQEMLTYVSDPTVATFLRGPELQALNPAFKSDVIRAVGVSYQTETRDPTSALTCPFQGDISIYQKNPTENFNWEAFYAGTNPACNPFWAKMRAIEMRDARAGAAMAAQRDEWNWGRGYYALTDNASDPLARRVLTPSVTVQESFQNILDSSVRQLEQANDIGQMIGALFAGLETQIIGGPGGLAGISKSTGGQPSYIDRVVSGSAQGLRNAATNLALQVLATARQVEVAYLQTANAIVAALTQAGAQLRGAENQCWDLIISRVCSVSAPNALNECTGKEGDPLNPQTVTYRVATSTAGYAQSVITTQISPLVAIAATNTVTSQAALARIDTLIRGVSNTSSPDAQHNALLALDALVAQRQIHTQTDIDGPNGIVRQLNSVQAAMNTLVTDTVKSWADDPSPAIGWCNVNNPAVIQAWRDTWRR